jgi:proteasome lid subunit RPN8/RPN11
MDNLTQMDMLKRIGRNDVVVGWYHVHPGSGCWVSGVDIKSQQVRTSVLMEVFVCYGGGIKGNERSSSSRRGAESGTICTPGLDAGCQGWMPTPSS